MHDHKNVRAEAAEEVRIFQTRDCGARGRWIEEESRLGVSSLSDFVGRRLEGCVCVWRVDAMRGAEQARGSRG